MCKVYKNLLVARNEKELEEKRQVVANELTAINKLIDSKVASHVSPYTPQYSTTKLNIMHAHQQQQSHSSSPMRRKRYQGPALESIKEESRPHSLNSTANLEK